MSIFKNGIKVSGQVEVGGSTGSASDIITGGDSPAFSAASSVVGDNWHEIDPLKRGQKSETMHVFLLAGQSNMAGGVTVGTQQDPGYTPDRQGVDAPHPRVLEVSKGNTDFSGYRTAPAGELQIIRVPGQSSEVTGASGMRLNMNQIFGKRFAELIGGDAKIVIINRAVGDTGFASGDWDAGNTGNLLDLAIQDVIAFLEAHPEASFSGICWHQGEDEITTGISEQDYRDFLTPTVAEMRSRIPGAATAPFVCGTMHRNIIESTNAAVNAATAVDAAHRNVKSYIDYSDVVIMDQFYNGDPDNDDDADPSTPAHFDFNAIRYMGRAYAEKMIGLIEDVKPPRQTGVWMEYDDEAGEFRDRWGSGHRVFNGTYIEDPSVGQVLSVVSGTGYNTDIPLSNTAYTKIIRVRFRTPALEPADNGIFVQPNYATKASPLGYQLISGALPNQLTGTATEPLGTWWSTLTHQHLYSRSTLSNTDGSGAYGIGHLITYDRYHTLALTYDSGLAVGSRFEEYIDGTNANIGTKLITDGGSPDDNSGGQTIPDDNLIVQIGTHGDLAQTNSWAGHVAAVIILPYAATPEEITGIHEEFDRREREKGGAVNLGYVNATDFDWKTLTKQGTYRIIIQDDFGPGDGATNTALNTNRPVEEHDLPWNAAQFTGAQPSLAVNVYDIQVEHVGSGRGFVKVRVSAGSVATALNGTGSGQLIIREWICQVSSNFNYTNDWTPQELDGGATVWTELTNYRQSPDGKIWESSIDNSGTVSWALV